MITQHLTQTAEAITQTLATQHTAIANAVRLIHECRERGGTVYTCGNGGSAATAAHFCNDLHKVASVRAFDVMSNTPLLTAYSNDDSYEFAANNIVLPLLKIGDVLVAISVSGNSSNVVRAAVNARASWAGRQTATIITLGSQRRGDIVAYSDVFIEAQSEDMATAEDVHLAICHAIVKGLQQ